MIKDIYILGSGGFAKEVAFLLESQNKYKRIWNIVGYVDKPDLLGTNNGKYYVTTTENELIELKREINIAIGIGKPTIVKRIIEMLKQNNFIKFPNIIHSSVIADWNAIKIGEGNIITANNVFTTDISIGSFNIFNLSCTLGHDSTIGNFNVFNPTVNLSGGLKIGDANLIGTGAQVLQYLEIGNNITLGAGSVATKSLIEEGIYVGIPAKPKVSK